MIVYGIKNCNTVKKALDWMRSNNIEFEFHDFKKLGISDEKIQTWQNKVSWESLINKRGTTWKKLPLEVQHSIVDAESAKSVMKKKTSLIKRPIIENEEQFLIGFDEDEYQVAFL